MPETSVRPHAPRDWGEALAALPLETPPAGGWSAIAARLDAHRRSRWPLWAASAAAIALALALALALPWPSQERVPATGVVQVPAASRAVEGDRLEQMYAQSAELEALLGLARDDRASSGTAALISVALDDQLGAIDMALMQPGLSREQQLQLWQQRVEALIAAAGFESNRRWLAAQGSRYDAALVLVD